MHKFFRVKNRNLMLKGCIRDMNYNLVYKIKKLKAKLFKLKNTRKKLRKKDNN